jgi:hypothetical protein
MHTQVDIVVGNPISHDNPIDCFILAVSYQHGDADGESDKTFTYYNNPEGIESLKHDVLSLEAVEDIDDCEDALTELYQVLGLEDIEAAIDTFRGDFYEGDHTTDYSVSAAVAGYDVVYYDKNGVEHAVDINLK